MNVNISDDSRKVFIVQRDSGKGNPVGMMVGSHERFPFAVRCARDLVDFGPQQFLD